MSLSILKEKCNTTIKHKCLHNCITQSKASRRITAASVGNVPQLIQTIIASQTQCGP